MVEAIGTQSALSVIRPLVVEIEPFPGECLSSVLVRACEANIFTKTSHLLNLIGLRAQASEAVPFTHTAAAPAIAKLLGTTAKQIESRMHPAVQDDFSRSTVDWFGDPIERRHIEAKVRRFAPHSLEEHAHFPAIWAIRLLDYCPITLELLASECPQCSRPLGWRACRSLFECENCGAPLLCAESQTLPPHLHDGARLGAALVSPTATVRQTALSSLPDPFSTWSPADALLGLLTLGEAQLSLGSSRNSGGAAGAAAHIAAGIEFARDWPDSLSRFVKVSTARSNTTSVRSGLGPLGKLFESSGKRTPIRDLVRSSISISFGEAVVPTKLYAGGIVGGACREGMLSALDASKRLGISGKRLRGLEGRSDTFLARQKAKGGTALYDKAAVFRLQDVLSSSVKPAVCAHQLGIPDYCVEALTSAGLVEMVTSRDAMIVTGRSLISKASIAALRERLQSQRGTLEGGITLREAMRRNGDPHDWVAVFESMLAGRIRFHTANCDSLALSDALAVMPNDIAGYVSRRSIGPGIFGINISCQTAAALIGTSQQLISAAVKIGFMDGKVGVRNSALPLERVLAFQKHFVFTDELREIFGLHQASIVRQLRKAGLKPAATISRTTVWLRSDIEKYRQEQRDICRA